MNKRKALKKLTINVPIYRQHIFVAYSDKDFQIIADYLCIDKEELFSSQSNTDSPSDGISI